MADKTETVLDVDKETLDEVAANLVGVNQARLNPTETDPTRPRVQGGAAKTERLSPSTQPFPERDMDLLGPAAFGTSTDGLELTGYTATQEFFLDASKLEFLPVAKPGLNLPAKRLYVIKAIHRDGVIVQLPQEIRHNNNAGGDPEDMIGLRRYQRKGILLLMNFETGIPWYCAAWDCWAQSETGVSHAGFCSARHAQHTLPNRFKESGEILSSLMSQGVTTSQVWGI